MTIFYQKLIPTTSSICDPLEPYHFLTEKHLQVLWFEQCYFNSLVSSKGETIEVISPGIWNVNAGPDFLKAHLKIGQREYKGDVEIHLTDQGWNQHKHHLDERYDEVILNISLWQSTSNAKLFCKNGKEILKSYFNLTLSLKDVLQKIDIENYPNKYSSNAGECASQVFAKLNENQLRAFFQSAAFWRLEKKLNAFQMQFKSISEQFIGGIACGLGYKKNSRDFSELFHYFYDYRDLPFDELLAVLLGCCGFLENNRNKEWLRSSYYKHLLHLWSLHKNTVLLQINFKLHSIRPFNHPIRRLVYLAFLLQDFSIDRIWNHIYQTWTSKMTTQTPLKNILNALYECIPTYFHSYWNAHYLFENNPTKKEITLMGNDLKLQIILNTFLPLVYGQLRQNGSTNDWEKFVEFYSHLKSASTQKKNYLEQRFFCEPEQKKLLNSALIVQGAYQLHQDFCTHFESSCQGCPFIERYLKTF